MHITYSDICTACWPGGCPQDWAWHVDRSPVWPPSQACGGAGWCRGSCYGRRCCERSAWCCRSRRPRPASWRRWPSVCWSCILGLRRGKQQVKKMKGKAVGGRICLAPRKEAAGFNRKGKRKKRGKLDRCDIGLKVMVSEITADVETKRGR